MSKIVEPGHNFMICPYNDAHQILQYRFQKHIVKCARQHPHIKLLVCPFNSCHRIVPEKMKVRKCKENVIDWNMVGVEKRKKNQDGGNVFLVSINTIFCLHLKAHLLVFI